MQMQLVSIRDFSRIHIAAIAATAKGAPKHTVSVCQVKDGRRFAILRASGDEHCAPAPEGMELGEYVFDQDTCLRSIGRLVDAWWLEMKAYRDAGGPPVHEVLQIHFQWGAVRELYKPAIYDGGPWPNGIRASEAWADAECDAMQGLVLAFPQIAELFTCDRYRGSANPRLAKVVDLALARTGKATRH